jgi:signal transduction histidine kinase
VLPRVRVPATQITQVFTNVIGNAIKYRSADRPVVQVRVAPDGDMWRFSIRDNGLGIRAEYTQQIFGVFKRLHGREIPGTGIGLAICKRVVEHHGGEIWVESEGEGKGSTFVFTLPAVEGG